MDEQVLIKGPRGRLVGMLHRPTGATVRQPAVLFCHAFGEERKSSALAMSRLARAVAGAGHLALRFDYYGTGDSEGEAVEVTLQSLMDDVACAASFLRGEAGTRRLCLLGLRLGATLAARGAEALEGCAGLALIEPVADGAAYFGGELRRRLLRQMLTGGRTAAPSPPVPGQLPREDAVLDMDGLALKGSTYQELAALGLRQGRVSFNGPVLVCQVHFNDRPRAELEAVCQAYSAAGAPVEFCCLVLPPFWSRIEVALADEVNAAVTQWLERALDAGTR